MAVAASSFSDISVNPPPPSSSSIFISSKSHSLLFSFPSKPTRPSLSPLHISSSLPNPVPKATASSTSTSNSASPVAAPPSPETFASRFAPDEARKGSDVLLERQGVTNVFAYPGGASMEIHQALTRSNIIKNVLPRHEQGGIFAAEGYARASGLPGVCITTSGPGATNLVSGLADAMLDSIPIVAITGQVPRRMIGTNAFQETPIVEVTRSITKHNSLILDVEDIPRIVTEVFYLATSGRPGPVLIDIPKDIQQQLVVPNWDKSVRLPEYMPRLPKPPQEVHLEQIVTMIAESKKPVLYVGGGCLNSSDELIRYADRPSPRLSHL